MSDELVAEIRKAHAAGTSVRELATLYGYPYGTLHSALTGRTYRQASGPLRTVTGRQPADLFEAELREYYHRRLQQMVDVSACGCHYFMGPVNADGYAHVVWAGFIGRVHELAYLLANGPLPPDHFVSHSCHFECSDRPDDGCYHRRCVNVQHLLALPHVGTHEGAAVPVRGPVEAPDDLQRNACGGPHCGPDASMHVQKPLAHTASSRGVSSWPV